MLSPLQERIATIIAGLSQAEDFALAGGGALIVRGDVDRKTRDLDFFGLSADAVDRLVPLAEQALREAGLQVKRVHEGPGFARFVIEDEDDRTELDLASDARLFPADQGPGFQILSAEELAADKLLAVFGRAEARDFVDLGALEDRFGLDRLFELAGEKDRGFQPTVFAEMMNRFGRLGRAEFQLDDVQYEELSRRVQVWRERALQLAQEHQRSREISTDQGPDMGLGV
ncbi:MAG: nucleotidyl transferase AbiEii/AbiGii toxin family protein [Acidimicrobiales bacterium]